MVITWLGMSCFRIQTANATVICDPYESKRSLKAPRIVVADVVVHSTPETHDVGPRSAFHIQSPGEYETKGVFCYGKQLGSTTIYLIEAEDIRIAFLGRLSITPENGELELIENADVLLIPVGGAAVLDGTAAAKLSTTIEPRVVIPMCFATTGHSAPFDTSNAFLKELGSVETSHETKFKVSKSQLPSESTEVVVLSPQ